MLNLILTAALAAQPCLAPNPVHHKRKALPAPAEQSCAAPLVRFLEADPEPVEIQIYIHYETFDMPCMAPYASADAGLPLVLSESPPALAYVGFGSYGATTVVYAQPSRQPPAVFEPPRIDRRPPAVAPELDPGSRMAGLTLLFGGIAVLRGRKVRTIGKAAKDYTADYANN
jgi:hypothetical protein